MFWIRIKLGLTSGRYWRLKGHVCRLVKVRVAVGVGPHTAKRAWNAWPHRFCGPW
jgi:hypothetical protein